MVVLIGCIIALSACTSAADKLTAFCEGWEKLVAQHDDDCEAMGKALRAHFHAHKNAKLYGSLNNDSVKSAKQGCHNAVKSQHRCRNNPALKQAMELGRKDL